MHTSCRSLPSRHHTHHNHERKLFYPSCHLTLKREEKSAYVFGEYLITRSEGDKICIPFSIIRSLTNNSLSIFEKDKLSLWFFTARLVEERKACLLLLKHSFPLIIVGGETVEEETVETTDCFWYHTYFMFCKNHAFAWKLKMLSAWWVSGYFQVFLGQNISLVSGLNFVWMMRWTYPAAWCAWVHRRERVHVSSQQMTHLGCKRKMKKKPEKECKEQVCIISLSLSSLWFTSFPLTELFHLSCYCIGICSHLISFLLNVIFLLSQ